MSHVILTGRNANEKLINIADLVTDMTLVKHHFQKWRNEPIRYRILTMGKALMIQGCGSNVGKSLLVAGLIRAAKKRGLRVAPFKPQNMSNNAAITVDGGEAGRAQSFQAYAAGIDFHSDMNPVLLKPESMIGSQIILNGKKYKSLKAREYYSHKDKFIEIAINSFKNLVNDYDLVIAEGAGSLAEVNLRKADIANMGFASVLRVPVIVTADIERGGVIAQLIGTKKSLTKTT